MVILKVHQSFLNLTENIMLVLEREEFASLCLSLDPGPSKQIYLSIDRPLSRYV